MKKITNKEAAEILGTTTFSLTEDIRLKTKGIGEIGEYIKRPGKTRGRVVITPCLLARYLNVTLKELEDMVNELKK